MKAIKSLNAVYSESGFESLPELLRHHGQSSRVHNDGGLTLASHARWPTSHLPVARAQQLTSSLVLRLCHCLCSQRSRSVLFR